MNIEHSYDVWLGELSERWRASQIKAAVAVNSGLLKFYWSLGSDIVERQMENTYGSGFFTKLSNDLKNKLPGAKGFSPQNLRYVRQFYSLYAPFIVNDRQHPENLPQVGGNSEKADGSELSCALFSIPWGHHKLLIDKFKEQPEKAIFFVRKTLANGWSRAMLLNFVDTNLYERQGKAVTNFAVTLPSASSELAQETLKDPYNFDFLTLSEGYHEKELKDALVNNIIRFLVELGNGFAFMGREYRLEVGGTEQFLDLLFYNTHLHCYVVVEVKTREFEASYLGQLSAYVSCANHLLKRDGDQPTIGLLICKSKDNVFARYSLEGYNQPLGIAEFEGINLQPVDFKSSLPTIEEIESGLKEFK